MVPKSTITSPDVYRTRRTRLAIWGMILAFISSLTMVTLSLFNSEGIQVEVLKFVDNDIITLIMLSLLAVGLMETGGGIVIVIAKLLTGTPLSEYWRSLKIKPATIFGYSAGLFGGPLATGCLMIGVGMAGITFSNSMVALAPVFASLAARMIYKERPSTRVWIGIGISVIGAIIAALQAPEGVDQFYLGIFFSVLAPIFFTIESLFDAKVLDLVDPLVTCSLYRCLGGGPFGIILAFILGVSTGRLGTWLEIFSIIFTSRLALIFLVIAILVTAVQYGTFFSTINYVGPGRAIVLVWSTPIWSIPIGFMLSGIFPYQITTLGVIGAVIVVTGMVMVVIRPSELLKIRNIEGGINEDVQSQTATVED